MTTNDRKKYCSQILRQILQKPPPSRSTWQEVSAGFRCSISCSIFPPRLSKFHSPPGPAEDTSSDDTSEDTSSEDTSTSQLSTMSANSYAAVAAAGTVMLSLQHTLRAILANYIFPTIVIPSIRRREVNRYHAIRRLRVSRKSWSRTAAKLSDRQFRRYFRMSKAYFQLLCDQIEDIISPSTFKSELYLQMVDWKLANAGEKRVLFYWWLSVLTEVICLDAIRQCCTWNSRGWFQFLSLVMSYFCWMLLWGDWFTMGNFVEGAKLCTRR